MQSYVDPIVSGFGSKQEIRPQFTGVAVPAKPTPGEPDAFVPLAPRSLREAGISDSQLEAFVLKFLLARSSAAGREIAEHLALPFALVEPPLHAMKAQRLVVFRNTAAAGDYVYDLTDLGAERARRHLETCTYFGAAPVSLEDYVASVEAQSVRRQRPRLDRLRAALSELVLDDDLLGQLGEAVNSGLGFLLYGESGNGKTSIAQRVTRAYGEAIWVPRAISVGGEILRFFDTTHHEMLPWDDTNDTVDGRKTDARWVRVRRPTIVAGGELTMQHLEVTTNQVTGISEAPLQLKSNCGTLVIDDFGRQRVSPTELLNRWIVPLERRRDVLDLASGRKFEVPFDQLIIFSTNMTPSDLVDEAFLRRIPYKIDVNDPSEEQFREVFLRAAREMGVDYRESSIDYLLSRHYRPAGRALRFCHARDLVQQVANFCEFRGHALAVTEQNLDAAVKNYFGK
jgi:hypothetical protein